MDLPAQVNQWKFPDAVRTAMDRNDLAINHSFDLTVEEILDFRKYVEQVSRKPMVRNFATTAPLLCTYCESGRSAISGTVRLGS